MRWLKPLGFSQLSFRRVSEGACALRSTSHLRRRRPVQLALAELMCMEAASGY